MADDEPTVLPFKTIRPNGGFTGAASDVEARTDEARLHTLTTADIHNFNFTSTSLEEMLDAADSILESGGELNQTGKDDLTRHMRQLDAIYHHMVSGHAKTGDEFPQQYKDIHENLSSRYKELVPERAEHGQGKFKPVTLSDDGMTHD